LDNQAKVAVAPVASVLDMQIQDQILTVTVAVLVYTE